MNSFSVKAFLFLSVRPGEKIFKRGPLSTSWAWLRLDFPFWSWPSPSTVARPKFGSCRSPNWSPIGLRDGPAAWIFKLLGPTDPAHESGPRSWPTCEKTRSAVPSLYNRRHVPSPIWRCISIPTPTFSFTLDPARGVTSPLTSPRSRSLRQRFLPSSCLSTDTDSHHSDRE